MCASSRREQTLDGGVRWLGGQVAPVEAGISLARESAGDPAVVVVKVPDGDSNALGHVQASLDDGGVVGRLLCQTSGRRREAAKADINFGEGYLDAKSDEGVELRGEICGIGGLADDEVALQPDAVDPHTRGLDHVDQRDGCGRFSASVFDVIVIVVELGSRVGGSSRGECEGDIRRSHDIVEHISAIVPAVIDRFVHDIPGIALALVVADLTSNVGIDDRGESRIGPRPGRHPRRELIVPDQIVASKNLAVSLCEVHDNVSLGVVENSIARLSILPLLSVAGGDLAEFIDVRSGFQLCQLPLDIKDKCTCTQASHKKQSGSLQDRSVGRVGELAIIGGRPEIQLAGGLGQLIQVRLYVRGSHENRGDGRPGTHLWLGILNHRY